MAPRVLLTPCYVIHARPYRESSLLVEALSREHGRVGLVARGARRAQSRLRGALQPFNAVLLSWAGGGELATLTEAEVEQAQVRPGGEHLISALYLNEMVYRLLARGDAHPGLYDVYAETLEHLRRGSSVAEGVLRRFEKRLLEAMGYGLMLDHEADGGRPVDPARYYRYELEAGPAPAGREDARERAGDSLLVSGATLIALAAECLELTPDVAREAKRLMRTALAPHLGARPVESRRMFGRKPMG